MLILIFLLLNAFIQLRQHYPAVMYFIYFLVEVALLYGAYKWIKHMIRGGWRTFWTDTTVETTYPGMIRCFSLDFWSMATASWLWVLLEHNGGLKMLWTFLLTPVAQLCFAVHCTFSSTDNSFLGFCLGVVYVALGVIWYLLWLPAQMKWVDCINNEGKVGASESGRKLGGDVNPNIGWMTNSIIVVFLFITPEVATFLYADAGLGLGIYWVQPFLILCMLGEFAHIGAATLILMGLAKMTADHTRVGLDEYGICFGTGW